MSVVEADLAAPVLAIAEDLFTAMIDGEPGGIRLWEGDVKTLAGLVEPLHAWVDVVSDDPARALLTTSRATADRLACALLGMAGDERVEQADLVDALGELANVVGGNVKSLFPDAGALTLPRVSLDGPPADGRLVDQVVLDWQGAVIIISIGSLDRVKGDQK